MTFASDVDLIFAVKNSSNHPKVQNDFQELLAKLKTELTPFSVDCRLRPEGASSQLVWDFEKYTEYLNTRARIWELQALLKASFVNGKENFFSKLIESFQKRISKLSEGEILKGINDIRSKSLSSFPAEMGLVDLKKNSGGLSDVEYIAHYLLLSDSKLAASFTGKSISTILNTLSGKSKNKKVLNELADNYIFIKNLEIFNQLAFSSSSSKLSIEDNKFKKLARFMEYENGATLKKKLNSVLQLNRETFAKFIK